ncbi:unnamed protein product, partial [Amoebophrya sp. A25]
RTESDSCGKKQKNGTSPSSATPPIKENSADVGEGTSKAVGDSQQADADKETDQHRNKDNEKTENADCASVAIRTAVTGVVEAVLEGRSLPAAREIRQKKPRALWMKRILHADQRKSRLSEPRGI